MIYELLDVYKKKCGSYNNVFYEMKFTYILLYRIMLPLSFLIPLYLLNTRNAKSLTITTVYFSLVMLVSFHFNNKAKKIVMKKYKIEKYTGIWNSLLVSEKMRIDDEKKISVFLKKKKMYDLDNCLILLDEINSEIEKIKPRFPIIPTIFGAMFISAFNNFVSWTYRDATTLDQGFQVLSFSLFFIFISIILYILLKFYYEAINDLLFSKDYDYFRSCKRVLELSKFLLSTKTAR